ncbi:MAG: outer membrane protein assembly factor BamD [Phycisphaerae bacterium]|nr:outer membrane protein assembly factor BamD [Phycisphaerae bacterium]
MRNVRNILWVLGLALAVGWNAADARADAQLVWNGTEWVSPAPAEPGTPEGDLVILRQMVADGQNKRVVKMVEEFLVAHGESPACEEAMNLAGQSLINQGQYWNAYKWYERQISTYPNGAFFERALDREFLIADAFVGGRKRKALKIFRVPADLDGLDMLMRIAAHAPTTPIAERALLRAADFHFTRAEYPQAVAIYEDFLKSHPLSEHRKYAMLQVARAYLLNYRGVQWDTAPLLDARKRYQLFAQAYPQDAEKENVEGILEEIRLGLAQKVYNTGRFYERTKHPRAAAFYYRKTIEDYPDTHWANSARGRLDMLGPLPTDARPFTPPPPETPKTKVAKASPEEAPPQAASTTPPPGRTRNQPVVDLPAGPGSISDASTSADSPDLAEQPVPLEDLSNPSPAN